MFKEDTVTRLLDKETEGGELTRKAVTLLAEAAAVQGTLHLPGVRDAYRWRLEQVVLLAGQALEGAGESREAELLHRVLVQACVARAEDARYGAGQLSRGAQRAPTLEDCDDGWQRVEQIASTAEEAALAAAGFAQRLNTDKARAMALRAEVAAMSARKTVQERNRAYTFHADPGFSFGEGWYLAAAALFAGLSIQIRPGAAQEVQARRFLCDAGLEGALRPYRSRPASPKHLTHIIAEAFRADAQQAQGTLRTAFLGDESPSAPLRAWIDAKVGGMPGQKVLLWVRTGDHHAQRNTCFDELRQLSELVVNAGLSPIFFGDNVPRELVPPGAVNLTLCWKEPLFQGPEMRRAQLHLFEELRCRHGLLGQIGVTTAGMDGPALMGLPTLYLTREHNVRLGKWVGAVPGYQEVVREPGYFAIIRTTLQQWQQCPPRTGEAITIEARKVVTFKPGSVLKDAINK
ncbi:HU family DNA-binding protein [Trichlorobacter lovleyi]|uniref:HU family DNA-binding protein n=1 Tax=Trichlorobacter lovleyi TaxID=313985 RepID=UPI00248030B7|nr:HU family DNA-binding protein [Trichlorobacter lovleyi]